MQYGFAIDHRTCIGCHACTVACKTEHEVPLGQFRTWVKYVDSGAYPDSTRDFGVMRCNHCTDAPCVAICPTQALFKREDGIVDFDNSVCIGCKACMQACPYDALYIDEDTHTAAKCNFCAHRVDDGLEPACVVVCPTESIWVGDLDDPDSAISAFVSSNQTLTRTPEQGTGPNVHYVGANPAVLDPLAAPVDDTYIWAQPDSLRKAVAGDLGGAGGPDAPRTTLNTAHPVMWGWKVATYLWTKAIGGGALVVAALALVLGLDAGPLGEVAAPVLSMAGLLATAVLLISDLKRPERFWMLMLRPNPTSWLFKGGLVLTAGAGLGFLWFVMGLLDLGGLPVVAAVAAVAGVFTAGYTAFLFQQAEGRDLWQTGWLFPHLVVQAVMAGAGALAVVALVVDPGDATPVIAWCLVAGTVGHLLVTVLEHGIAGRPDHRDHGTPNERAARRLMTQGRHATTYRLSLVLAALALVVGVVGALTTLALVAVAGVLVQLSLIAYETVFVRAGQEVPLS